MIPYKVRDYSVSYTDLDLYTPGHMSCKAWFQANNESSVLAYRWDTYPELNWIPSSILGSRRLPSPYSLVPTPCPRPAWRPCKQLYSEPYMKPHCNIRMPKIMGICRTCTPLYPRHVCCTVRR